MSELSRLEAKAIESPGATGSLRAAEKGILHSFRESPVGRKLSQGVKSATSIDDARVDKELKSIFNGLVHDTEKLKSHVDGLPDRKLYQLYAFETKFREFTAHLGSDVRTDALNCVEKDNEFLAPIKECLGRGTAASCATRMGNIAVDILPLISLYDAYSGLQIANAARDTGVATGREWAKEVSYLTTQSIGGAISSAGVVSGLARGALSRVAGRSAASGATTRSAGGTAGSSGPEPVVFDSYFGRSTYNVVGNDLRYMPDAGIRTKYIHVDPPRGNYPALVDQRSADVLEAIVSGRPIKPADSYRGDDLARMRELVSRWGDDAKDRIALTARGQQANINGNAVRIYNPNPSTRIRTPVADDFSPQAQTTRNGITSAEEIRVPNGDKTIVYEAIDVPKVTTNPQNYRMTNYRTNTESLNNRSVRVLVGTDRMVSGRYLSAGGSDIPRGASPNHFHSRYVDVHFVEVGDEILMIPAKDARIFVQTSGY